MSFDEVVLRVRTGESISRVEVSDGRLERVPIPDDAVRFDGSLELPVAPGLYSVRAQVGETWTQRIVRVIGDRPHHDVDLAGLGFDSAVPLDHTRTTREYHMYTAQDASRTTAPGWSGDSRLFVFVRAVPSPKDTPARTLGLSPTSMMWLLDPDGGEHALAMMATRNLAEGWEAVSLELPAGTYRLQLRRDPEPAVELPLILMPGWQTQLFAFGDDGARGLDLGSCVQLMADAATGFDPNGQDLRYSTLAAMALDRGESLYGEPMRMLLQGKFHNPLLGILGAQLLLARDDPDRQLLDVVIANTESLLLGGDPHPDLEVLKLARDLRFRSGRDARAMTFPSPPLLRSSWRQLVAASARIPSLIPRGSLSDRISDHLWGDGPWLAWREPPGVDVMDVLGPLDVGATSSLEGMGVGAGLESLGVEPSEPKPALETLLALDVTAARTPIDARPAAAALLRFLQEAQKSVSEERYRELATPELVTDALRLPPATLEAAARQLLSGFSVPYDAGTSPSTEGSGR